MPVVANCHVNARTSNSLCCGDKCYVLLNIMNIAETQLGNLKDLKGLKEIDLSQTMPYYDSDLQASQTLLSSHMDSLIVNQISAQFYGIISHNSKHCKPFTPCPSNFYHDSCPKAPKLPDLIPSSFTHSNVICRTIPVEIFSKVTSGLELIPKNSKAHISFQFNVPIHLFPTYKGTMISVTYFIAIKYTVEKYKKTWEKIIRVPINLSNAISSLSPLVSSYVFRERFEFRFSTIEPYQEQYPLDFVFRSIQAELHSEKRPSFYDISYNGGKLGRLSIGKRSYFLGETIYGTFDLEMKSCHQISISLIHREELNQDFRTSETKHWDYEMVHHVDSTRNSLSSSFHLGIPLKSYPQVLTDIFNIVWILKFRFSLGQSESSLDHIDWELPIRVFEPITLDQTGRIKTCSLIQWKTMIGT